MSCEGQPEGCNRLLAVTSAGHGSTVPRSLLFAASLGLRGQRNSVVRTARQALKAQVEATGGFSVRLSHGKEHNDEQYQSQAGGR